MQSLDKKSCQQHVLHKLQAKKLLLCNIFVSKFKVPCKWSIHFTTKRFGQWTVLQDECNIAWNRNSAALNGVFPLARSAKNYLPDKTVLQMSSLKYIESLPLVCLLESRLLVSRPLGLLKRPGHLLHICIRAPSACLRCAGKECHSNT